MCVFEAHQSMGKNRTHHTYHTYDTYHAYHTRHAYHTHHTHHAYHTYHSTMIRVCLLFMNHRTHTRE